MKDLIKQMESRKEHINTRMEALNSEYNLLDDELKHIEELLAQYKKASAYYTYVQEEELKVNGILPGTKPFNPEAEGKVELKAAMPARNTYGRLPSLLDAYLHDAQNELITPVQLRKYVEHTTQRKVSNGSISYYLSKQLEAGVIEKHKTGIYYVIPEEKRKTPGE